MKPEYKKAVVISNDEIGKGVYKLSVSNIHGEAFKEVRPGQFYMLRCWESEPLLSRPVSLYSISSSEIVFLYAVFGKGTKLFSTLKAGDEVEVLGPLGNGFDVEKIKGKVAVVSGGVGIAPMLEIIRRLKDYPVDVYAGFRKEVYVVDEMREWVEQVHIATEDGSCGHRGYITDLLAAERYDIVLCCGPEPMMEKVVRLCREKRTAVYVSMEKHMACGVGACLVCTCKTVNGNQRTCKEGPVFSGDELIIS